MPILEGVLDFPLTPHTIKPHILNLMNSTLTHPVNLMNSTLEVLKALANDVRFEIVSMLAQGECCVCDLEALLGLGRC